MGSRAERGSALLRDSVLRVSMDESGQKRPVVLVEQVALGIDGNHREDSGDWHDVAMLLSHDDPDMDTKVGMNEQQTIWCNDTSGSFRLSFKGETTQWIDWDASAATVESAINLLHTVKNRTGAVSVSIDNGQVTACASSCSSVASRDATGSGRPSASRSRTPTQCTVHSRARRAFSPSACHERTSMCVIPWKLSRPPS